MAYPITFAIEIVPRAIDYRFHAALMTCPGAAAGHIYTEAVDPSVLIEWGTRGEDFQSLEVTCAGALEICGLQLAVTSRTSTPGNDNGMYGQGIPPDPARADPQLDRDRFSHHGRR